MANIAQIVTKIQRAMLKKDGVPEELMTKLAEAYSEEAYRVNERLDKAVALISQGLRSEAIQLVNIEPNVLDEAAAALFPELDTWTEILAFYGIPTPTLIDTESVDRVSEAINESLPLERLLVRQRQFAIVRAPLKDRIAVLSKIASLDPTNIAWQSDLESWQQQRLKQIEQLTPTLVEQADQERLKGLLAELKRPDWVIPPPPKLYKTVRDALASFSQMEALRRINDLSKQLEDDFGKFDEGAAAATCTELRGYIDQVPSQVPADVLGLLSDAEDWLDGVQQQRDRETEYRKSLGKLESALKRMTYTRFDRDELDTLLFDARRLGDVPSPLMQRYKQVIAAAEWRAKGKLIIACSAVALLLLLAGSGAIWWQIQASREQAVVSYIATMTQLLEDKNLPRAEELRSSQKAYVLNDERCTGVSSELDRLLAAEASRRERFERFIASAETNDPQQRQDSALAEASRIAVTESEKQQVQDLQRRYSEWDRLERMEHTRRLTDGLAEVRAAIKDLATPPNLTPNPTVLADINASLAGEIVKIDETLQLLEAAAAATPSASNDLRRQIPVLRNELLGLRSGMARTQAEAGRAQRILEALVSAPGSIAGYTREFERLQGSERNPILADELRQTARHIGSWMVLDRWNDLTQRVQNFEAKEADATTIGAVATLSEELVVIGRSLPSDFPKGGNEAWEQRRLAIELFDKRQQALTSLLRKLEVLPFGNAVTVIDGKGTVYYTSAINDETLDDLKGNEVKPKGGQRSIEVMATMRGAFRRQTIPIPINEFRDQPRTTMSNLRQSIGDRKAMIAFGWQQELAPIMQSIIQEPTLQSLVKEELLYHFVQALADGAANPTKSHQELLTLLRDRQAGRNEWFAQTENTPGLDAPVSTKVQALLDALVDSKETISTETAAAKAYRFQIIGICTRDQQGKHVESVSSPPAVTGPLYVTRMTSPDSSSFTLVKVGQMENGRVVNFTAKEPVGTPIFVQY